MRRLTALVVATLACATGAVTARAQAPYLVKDVNPTADVTRSSDPRHLQAGDDIAYFSAFFASRMRPAGAGR